MSKRIITKAVRLKRNRRGATAVEFAIVSSIFFMIMLASFEFSRLNVIRHTADNAAYEAARHAMVPGATIAEAKSKANSILRTVGARGTTVTIDPTTLGPEVDTINVRIDVPLNQNGWVVPKFTKGRNLTAECTLRTERAE